ncbi:protein of unknown function (plasmid) [Agreia sp. COWG]|nr:protein of unknown function [Agreia sp. COWG]
MSRVADSRMTSYSTTGSCETAGRSPATGASVCGFMRFTLLAVDCTRGFRSRTMALRHSRASTSCTQRKEAPGQDAGRHRQDNGENRRLAAVNRYDRAEREQYEARAGDARSAAPQRGHTKPVTHNVHHDRNGDDGRARYRHPREVHCSVLDLEGGVVAEVARRVPHVGPSSGSRLRGRRSGPRLVVSTARSTDLAAALACASGCPGDTRRCVAQAGTDLVDLELDRGALFALFRLVGALTQTTGRNDAAALRQRSSDVLGEFTPDACAQEECLAVFPVVRGTIERARRGSDSEVGNRQPALRVTQFRIAGEVAHHGDYGFASHDDLFL